MDWNWFFSSAAQSAAAIVGIFAAFVITKIVNNQTEFSNNKKIIQKFISASLRFEDEAKERYFNWYCERKMERKLKELKEHLFDDEDSEILTPEQYYSNINFPEFIEKQEVINTIQQKIVEHQNPPPKRSGRFPFEIDIPVPPVNVSAELSISQQLLEEENQIYKLVNDTNHHVRDQKDFLETIKGNPESSNLITFSVISASLLFFVGVIYPLSFLPQKPEAEIVVSLSAFWDVFFSLKGMWLFSVSLIFNLILLVFFIVNLRMKYSKMDIEKLKKYSKISYYSPYFEIMENNKIDN